MNPRRGKGRVIAIPKCLHWDPVVALVAALMSLSSGQFAIKYVVN
jgi:hypothetical protein